MNFKTTYFLFTFLALLLCVLGFAVLWGPAPVDSSAYVLPSAHATKDGLKPDAFDKVEIARVRPTEESITLVRDAETKVWRLTQPLDVRGDKSVIEGLIRQVLEVRREQNADVLSLKQGGLEPPAATIRLYQGETVLELRIGDVSPGSENQVVYVSSSDRPTECLTVSKRDLDDTFKAAIDFRDRDLLTRTESDIVAVKLVEGKKAPVAVKREDETHWTYTEPDFGAADPEGEATPASSTPDHAPNGLKPLLQDLTSIRVEYRDAKSNDFVADDVGDADLAKYNLDANKADVLRITIEKSASAKPATPVTLLVGVSKAVDGKYFARVDGEKGIVKVAAKEIDPLRKLIDDPGALRERGLVHIENFKNPDAIDVQNGSGLLEFRKADSTKPWEMYRGDTAVKTDDKAVQELIAKLTQKAAIVTFPDPKTELAKLGLDKPTATVQLWVDGVDKAKKDEKKEEGKDEKKEESKSTKPKLKGSPPLVKLTFGTSENGLVNVLREVGSQKTLAKVKDDIFNKVKEGPLAYLDRALPKFNDLDAAQDITKLVLVRNGVTTEMHKDAKATTPADAWKLDKPADLAGRTADANTIESILRVLNTLQPVRLIAEKPEPEAFDRQFGLKTPTIKVTITQTKDGKDTAYEYDFGKDADALTTYAHMSQRPDLTFLVDKAPLAPLSKDLRDPAIFRFDASKVKALKLVGWNDVAGAPLPLELERKDATEWTAKTPPKFLVGAAKVNQLVGDLANLKALSFTGRKVTAKERDDNGLTPEKGGLSIELTIDGEKDPLTLMLGNLDADKQAYFATSNKLGDELVTVRKELFEKAREKRAYFNP